MKTNYFKITDDGKLKTSELLEQCRAQFPVWSYYENDRLDKDFPKPKKATTRWFKKVQEADEDLVNKSANDLDKEGIKGITLRERLIMELAYFAETGDHLDKDNWTLCSGSRYAGGDVPDAGWGGGGFYVYWCGASARYLYLRSRRAFATDPSTLNLESLDLESAIELVKKEGYLIFKPI